MICGVTSDIEASEHAMTESRGRPRDEERTAAILEATHVMIHTNGWHDLTMNDIAKAAGCGLATIYRRWATKEELVAAAMRARPLPIFEESGDPRVDLRSLLVAAGTEIAQMGESLIGFISATQSDPQLRSAFSESLIANIRPTIGGLLAGIVGADSPHCELLIDAITGSLIMRAGIMATLDSPDSWADEVLALVDELA